MRLPNGYGSCVCLGKNKRKKYAARITIGWEDGKQQYKYIGYYETRAECLKALAQYSNPFTDLVDSTFSDVYEMWSEKKSQVVITNTMNSYRTAYKHSSPLYKMKFKDIKLIHMQRCIDAQSAVTAKRYMKFLYSELFDFAIKNEIVSKEKDMTQHLETPSQAKSERHNKFTNEELKVLWENSSDKNVQLILIMIYTGVRPSELFSLQKSEFYGDHFKILEGKTENAARIVPIHKDVREFFKSWNCPTSDYVISNDGYTYIGTHYPRFKNNIFVPTLERLNILIYNTNIVHTPYDTRSTFTSLWMTNKLDEAMRRKIQGHSGEGMGEKYYAHFSLETLLEETNKLPSKF